MPRQPDGTFGKGPQHNHVTRDIKPNGSDCPACQAFWDRAANGSDSPACQAFWDRAADSIDTTKEN